MSAVVGGDERAVRRSLRASPEHAVTTHAADHAATTFRVHARRQHGRRWRPVSGRARDRGRYGCRDGRRSTCVLADLQRARRDRVTVARRRGDHRVGRGARRADRGAHRAAPPRSSTARSGPTCTGRAAAIRRCSILGHHDTVFPLGTVGRAGRSRSPTGVATGPGVFDMKAGIVQAIHAVAALDDRVGCRAAVHRRRGGRLRVVAGAARGAGASPAATCWCSNRAPTAAP